jgi:YHS domain-containing protein
MMRLVSTFLMFLLLLALARALLRFLGGVVQGATGRASGGGAPRPAAPPPTKMVQDPVCGTYVVPGKAVTTSRGGHTQFFCSEACRQKYLAAS